VTQRERVGSAYAILESVMSMMDIYYLDRPGLEAVEVLQMRLLGRGFAALAPLVSLLGAIRVASHSVSAIAVHSKYGTLYSVRSTRCRFVPCSSILRPFKLRPLPTSCASLSIALSPGSLLCFASLLADLDNWPSFYCFALRFLS
jgi:hypothetical protein